MSISEREVPAGDFGRWISADFAKSGPFTALAVLSCSKGAPPCFTYFNVIGDEVDWGGIAGGRFSEKIILQQPSNLMRQKGSETEWPCLRTLRN